MIDVQHLTKRYGDVVAVDDVSFTVQPGHVTGFLGPNGAGKSTTMRMILGLDAPTAGSVPSNGGRYRELDAPLRTIGALLDAGAVDGGRTAANHLRWLAHSNGIEPTRVGHVLELVGLGDVADRRVGRSRSDAAAARHRRRPARRPGVLMFDEPTNGLDPDGIIWLRATMRRLAAEGRAVFVSSHLMSEVAQTADHVIVIGRGRIVADAPIDTIIAQHGLANVYVRAERQHDLSVQLARHGAEIDVAETAPSASAASDRQRSERSPPPKVSRSAS